MRYLPHSFFTAQSRITSRHSARDLDPSSSRPSSHRAVLAAVKAWPVRTKLADRSQRRPALTAAAAGASAGLWSGRRNGSGSNKETDKQGSKKERKRSSRRCRPLDFPGPIQGWATAPSPLPTVHRLVESICAATIRRVGKGAPPLGGREGRCAPLPTLPNCHPGQGPPDSSGGPRAGNQYPPNSLLGDRATAATMGTSIVFRHRPSEVGRHWTPTGSGDY
jgi:hypothetical protein